MDSDQVLLAAAIGGIVIGLSELHRYYAIKRWRRRNRPPNATTAARSDSNAS